MFDFKREMRGRTLLNKTKRTVVHRNMQRLPRSSEIKAQNRCEDCIPPEK